MADKFEELLDQSMAESYSVGNTVKGKVVQINEEGIFVDIGTKSEAILEYNKVLPDDIPDINVGSELEAKIIAYKDGIYHLSKKALDFERGWNQIRKDFDSQNVINIKIQRQVNNGYYAEAYNVASGFIHEKNFTKKPNIGDVVEAVVNEYNPKLKKVAFSRIPILVKEKKRKIEEEYANIRIGLEVEGRVEKLSNFGAFVRITDHVVGLLHISEMSHDHIKAPSSVCKVGDKLKVRVINIDDANGRVGLSHKDTYTDPILDVVEGEDYDGVIDNLTEFGAFVKLPNQVVGLVHISEVSYSRFEKLSDVLRSGQKVRVKVINVNIRDRRVSLSIKALEQDPWEFVHEKYAVGERVDVTVKEMNNAGIVVTIDTNFEGFIPIGEIAYERIEHPSKLHAIGDVVKAQIINIDSPKRKVRLSIRQTLDRFAEETDEYVRVTAEDTKPTGRAMTFGDLIAKSGLLDMGHTPEASEEPSKEPEPIVIPTPAEAPVEVVEADEQEVVVETEDIISEPEETLISDSSETSKPDDIDETADETKNAGE